MLAWSRTLTGNAMQEFPASVISRATVLIVDFWVFGSGGNSLAGIRLASEVVLAETTTAASDQINSLFYCLEVLTEQAATRVRDDILAS